MRLTCRSVQPESIRLLTSHDMDLLTALLRASSQFSGQVLGRLATVPLHDRARPAAAGSAAIVVPLAGRCGQRGTRGSPISCMTHPGRLSSRCRCSWGTGRLSAFCGHTAVVWDGSAPVIPVLLGDRHPLGAGDPG
jgi:hypothetical protein